MVVDDQAVVRAGFAAIIDAEPDLAVVAEASDGAHAVELAGHLTPDVVLMDIRMLIEAFAHLAPAPDPARLGTLTPREREILTLVAAGLANAEIAGALGVTTGTVKSHVNALLRKLGLRDRVQATIFAYDTGLTRPRGT
ncbi:response regulator transcription factor [Streptomyces sp. AC550_RSS872]|uniref:response regulator transcription factor n=1 Tax=Streptomyces sp. AC550_RSS872 TaxID=2823689 RepID=UPI001C2623FE|nr:response regulator transcription factor [Streptomyces sp. AC550_RSS872]